MYSEAFNNPEISRDLLTRIHAEAAGLETIRLMEVCGTHTMAIGRFGLRRLLPANLRLLSGPGCPVCVTPAEVIDNTARLALARNITILTYGDMIRVPGISTSLEEVRSRGARIRVITSPVEVLETTDETLFLAVGFETTTAPIIAVLEKLIQEKRSNVSLYASFKTIPNALLLLQNMKESAVDGFILPGHVSTIIGTKAYQGLQKPAVIAGFEMADILRAILNLLIQIKRDECQTQNNYTRVVTDDGNTKAKRLIETYLEPCNDPWRGLGPMPGCSLRIRDAFAAFDANKKYSLPALSSSIPKGCSCGEFLKGSHTPDACPLFGQGCTPAHPVGPCMVSSEGACAAYYRYEWSHS